jgi:hypothetical protein
MSQRLIDRRVNALGDCRHLHVEADAGAVDEDWSFEEAESEWTGKRSSDIPGNSVSEARKNEFFQWLEYPVSYLG